MEYGELLAELGKTKLVAVSKTKPVSAIMALYVKGQRIFGENKVQEMLEKQAELPSDIEWHMIGHLQTNKVKYIAPFVAMIESVDSLKLLFEIEKQAAKHQRSIDVLLQMHIAQEETKFGMNLKELVEVMEYYTAPGKPLGHVCIRGLMGMATLTDDEQVIREEFRTLKQHVEFIRRGYLPGENHFTELSMGMSHDYRIAISEGSTLVRIGSLLFGDRS